jgi:hypothetical protein
MLRKHSANSVAEKLARNLGIPSWRGGVFVWSDGGVVKLVISVDRDWLSRQPPIVDKFEGYPVEVVDRIVGVAGSR